MESHHSYLSDESDGPGYQPDGPGYQPDGPGYQPNGPGYQSDRGNAGPDRDRPAGEAGYASVPVDTPGGVGYGAPSTYSPPEQRNGFDLGYRDLAQPAEQQAGYPPAVAPQSPPAVAPQSPPMPPGFTPGLPPEPRYAPPSPGTATSAFPHLSGEGAYPVSGDGAYAVTGDGAAAGRPLSGGEARPGAPGAPGVTGAPGAPGAPGAGRGAGVRDEETQVVRHAAEPLDRSALRRTPGGPGRVGDGVYRSRRPGTAVVIAVVAVVFELMALRLLAAAFLASTVQVGGSIASAFLVIGLPMFGLGLYGLLSGAAAAPGAGPRAWLRAPLVYLPVGLALFVCAGLAAS